VNIDISSLVKNYGPIAARYVATAFVGLLIAMFNHFKISLDPATVNALTVGLTGTFAGLIVFAFRNKAADRAATVNTAVHAALTGEVPEALAVRATAAQAAAIEASPIASVVPIPVPTKPTVT
jgi:hypothetical protein